MDKLWHVDIKNNKAIDNLIQKYVSKLESNMYNHNYLYVWRIFRWIHEIVTVVTSWKEHWRMKSTECERNLLSKYLQR